MGEAPQPETSTSPSNPDFAGLAQRAEALRWLRSHDHCVLPKADQVAGEVSRLLDALRDREGAPAPISADQLKSLLVDGCALPIAAINHFKSKLSVKLDSKHDRTSHFHVFVAWPTACEFSKTALDAIDRKRGPGLVPLIPCLKRANEGRILDDHVAQDIRDAHRMVALLNLKNANVTFELGFALGRGIPACPAVLTADGKIPPWINEAKTILMVAQVAVCRNGKELLETLIGHEDPRNRVERGLLLNAPEKGTRNLVLCSNVGTSGELGTELREERSDLDFVDESNAVKQGKPLSWSIDKLHEVLSQVSRVLWIIGPIERTEQDPEPHGFSNTVLALVAGYAVGAGLTLDVLVHHKAPQVADVLTRSQKFRDFSELSALVEKIAPQKITDAYPSPPQSLLAALRQYNLKHHDLSIPSSAYTKILAIDVEQREHSFPAKRPRNRSATGHEQPEESEELPLWESTLEDFIRNCAAANSPTRTLTLCGQPGSGKTTSLRDIAFRAAETPDLFPPFVIYAHAQELGGRSLLRLLAERHGYQEAQIAADLQAIRPEPRNAAEVIHDRKRNPDSLTDLTLRTQDAPVWLLVDGWDEIAPMVREKATREIRAALLLCPQAQVVVASREVGEPRTAFDGPKTRHAVVRGFSPQRQLEFLESRVRVPNDPKAGFKLYEAARKHPRIAQIMSTPLVLDLLVDLYLKGEPIPHRRTALYAAAVRVHMQRKWEARREQDSALPGRWVPTTAEKLLASLTLAIHRDSDLGGISAWSFRQLLDLTEQIVEKKTTRWQLRASTWQGSPERFLDDVGEYSGVLVPQGDAREAAWSFPHRSFREYPAALALHEAGAGEWSALLECLEGDLEQDSDAEANFGATSKAYWAEVFVFLAALAKPQDANRILEALVKSHSDLAARALPQMEALDPEIGVPAFFGLDEDHRDGDLFVELLSGWIKDIDLLPNAAGRRPAAKLRTAEALAPGLRKVAAQLSSAESRHRLSRWRSAQPASWLAAPHGGQDLENLSQGGNETRPCQSTVLKFALR